MNTPLIRRAFAGLLFAIIAAVTPRLLAQSGISSPCVEFNGTSSYMLISTFSQSFQFTNVLTIEAWVKPRSMKCNTIFCNGSGYTTNTGFILMVGWGGGACGDAMKIAFWGAGAWDYSTGTVPLNAWSHVAVVFDGTNKYFYINGVLDRTAPRSGVIANYGTSPTIGMQGYGNTAFNCACNAFDGQIDELRIWRTNRTAAEISANMGREVVISAQTNLFANYRFDEGAGLGSRDSTGTNGTAGIAGGVLWVLGSSPVPYLGALIAGTTATNIGVTNATLQAAVNPNAQATTVWFEWGTTTNFGNVTATQNIGSGTNWLVATQLLTNLTANQTYFFRAVASNASLANVSSNRSFTPSLFSDISVPLVGTAQGAAGWADYDNDGFLDFFYSGTGVAKLYRNNGNGTFTENSSTAFIAAYSVAWGDFDNDGWADLLLGGTSARVYRNNGDGTFTSLPGMPALVSGVAQWIDYDSDGRLDILAAGQFDSGSGPRTVRIYRNNGNSTVSYVDPGFPFSMAQFSTAVASGDLDNDGFPDVFLSGQQDFGGSYVASIYRNNRNGTFSILNAGLPGMSASAVRFADFNNDGFNDFLLNGNTPSGGLSNRLYFGNGAGALANAGLSFSNISATSLADFDNDGRTDFLAQTYENNTTFMRVLQNAAPTVFTDMGIALPPAVLSAIDAGDFDNDGRVDLFIAGVAGPDIFTSPRIAAVFHNNLSTANSPPTAPGGLTASPIGTGVWLSWNAASDAQTPVASLTYNVRVGTSPGGNQIVSALSAPNGYRRIPRAGNADLRRTMFVPNLTSGTTYYWSVQAVDQSFAGSPFAAEQTFLQQTPFVTTGGSSNITFNSASLIGVVNPNGSAAGGWFEFGTTTNYGSSTAVVGFGSGSSPLPVSLAIGGLTKLTVYHFRLVATNTSGITYGADQTFQSQFLAPSPVQITRNLLPGQNTTRVLYLTNLLAGPVALTNVLSPAVAWVRPYTNALAIGANGVGQVLLTFDASGLANGIYNTTLLVNTGAGMPTLPVPLTLVVGAPGVVAGDINGDGIVDDAEFASVLTSYYQSAPPTISSVTSPSGTTFSFGLSNLNSLSPTVLATTNVALPLNQWDSIGSASLFYRFVDPTATNYSQRFYELRFP
jgi:hypothetical protein